MKTAPPDDWLQQHEVTNGRTGERVRVVFYRRTREHASGVPGDGVIDVLDEAGEVLSRRAGPFLNTLDLESVVEYWRGPRRYGRVVGRWPTERAREANTAATVPA